MIIIFNYMLLFLIPLFCFWLHSLFEYASNLLRSYEVHLSRLWICFSSIQPCLQYFITPQLIFPIQLWSTEIPQTICFFHLIHSPIVILILKVSLSGHPMHWFLDLIIQFRSIIAVTSILINLLNCWGIRSTS